MKTLVVPIGKLLNLLLALGIIGGLFYAIYQKMKYNKDVLSGIGDKLSGDGTAFGKGKI